MSNELKLFEEKTKPLAERIRPENLDEFIGQKEILSKESPLYKSVQNGNIPSMILWGPPGTGKTTLAHIIKNTTKSVFVNYSAVISGIREIKDLMKKVEKSNSKVIMFIDEIHRFNKSQQDAFLPYIEKGDIILIGATTENPSFELNSALLSRCRVFIFKKFEKDELKEILDRGLNALDRDVNLSPDAMEALISHSEGDARRILNILEYIEQTDIDTIDESLIEQILQKKILLFDKKGEYHFDLISALHKSLRGSDVNGSLYWLGRMLEGGEDPLYIMRRLVRFATEDIGLADPNALQVTIAAKQAVEFIGMPEAGLAVAEAAIYLATAPKSNSVYMAYKKVSKLIGEDITKEVPLHLRNAPTKLMKDIGYSKGYKYPHDYKNAFIKQDYLPKEYENTVFYEPSGFGFEKEIKKRIDWWEKLKKTDL